MKLWASPWSPPAWMKYNKHYALKGFPKTMPANIDLDEYGIDFRGRDNGPRPICIKVGKEMVSLVLQTDSFNTLVIRQR